jgi:hypothetical protein
MHQLKWNAEKRLGNILGFVENCHLKYNLG